MEDWKIALCKDQRLLKILDTQFDQEEYLVELLNQSQDKAADLSDIFTKLSSIKQQIVNSFDHSITTNYDRIAQDIEQLSEISLNMKDCQSKITSMKSTLNKINHNFLVYYEMIANKTPTLKNSYEALDLAKAALKFVQSIKSLKIVTGPKLEILDLNKVSLIIRDLVKLLAENDLNGLPFYEKERDYINKIRDNVIAANDKKFSDALNSKNAFEIGHCLQNYYNLSLLSERIQSTVNAILKNINSAWKTCLTKELDRNQANSVMIFGNSLKATVAETLSYNTQIWMLSTCLKNRDSNSLEEFRQYLRERNFVNIFKVFWDKQILILSQGFGVIKRNQNQKYTTNKYLLTRNTPKLYHLFEDFVASLTEYSLLNPDPEEKLEAQVLQGQLLNSLEDLLLEYYEIMKKEVNQKLEAVFNLIYEGDCTNTKAFSNQVHAEVVRVQQFLNYEIKDNIKSEHIYKEFANLVIDQVYETADRNLKRYESNKSQFILHRFFTLLVSQVELMRLVTNLVASRQNYELPVQKVDQLIELTANFERSSLPVIFQNFFENSIKLVGQLHEFYQNSIKVNSAMDHVILENLFSFLNGYSVAVVPYLDSSYQFLDHWEKLLRTLIYALLIVYASMDNLQIKVIEACNKDFDLLQSFVEKWLPREDDVRILVQECRKVTQVDSESFANFWEKKHDFCKNLDVTFILVTLLRRAEREFKVSVYNIKTKEKEKNILSLIRGYIDKEQSTNFVKFYDAFSDASKLKEAAGLLIQEIEQNNQNLEKNKTFSLLKAIVQGS